jgi:hypothetical protein
MRIQQHTWRSRAARAAVAALVGLGVATSASAGTVYSWETKDGTFAFTDDRKRIPSSYRGQAKARSMAQLSNYDRFTESSVKTGSDYDARLRARLDRLRDGGAVAIAAPGPGGTRTPATFLVRTSGGRRSTTQMGVPLHMSDEPVIVDDVRVRPDSALDSLATRHITVVRQGGRVISVSRPNQNEGPLMGPYESEVLE